MSVGRKIGRAGNATLRRQAQQIVNAYRPVADCPNGEFLQRCTDDEYPPRVLSHGEALHHVLRFLQDFAKTGSFEPLASSRRALMMMEIWKLQAENTRRKDIIERLMAKYNLSRSTVERTIRKVSPPSTRRKT